MTIFQAIILGIVQGLTEYLPVSSSAHLVIVPYLLGWTFPEEQVFVFDVLVQLGTLVAVVVFFWKDLVNIVIDFVKGIIERKPFATDGSRMGWLIILASIPGGLAGITVKPLVEAAFKNPRAVAILLLVTAALMLAAERAGRKERGFTTIAWLDALLIGLGQALAIFPGISRSGATISIGLFRGLKRADAAKFSFLMSIPIMLAAGLYSALDLRDVSNLTSFLPAILSGTLAAAIVGYLSIKWLLSFLNKHPLSVFSIYCAILGAFVLIVSFIQ
ncbi:MAG: undecaprenyl-diphosphatase UppP [Leptolinea sp.]|nr:undecaprenyl-diphosphatase UppP [Leptolinea sp.]